MARVIDRAGIQFRVLNRSKGQAVRGPRAQADRKLYRQAMQALLAERENLSIIEAAAEDLILDSSGAVAGVVTGSGARISAGAVVITTGTFLRGLIHIGEEKISAGRVGEKPSVGLGADARALRIPPGTAQDRNAAAPGRQDHRLGGARIPARR